MDREVQVIKYLQGELSGDELRSFMDAMTSDESLKKMVEDFGEQESFLQRKSDIRSSIKSLDKVHEEFRAEKSGLSRRSLYLFFFSIIGLGVLYLMFNWITNANTSQIENSTLFAEYFNPESVSFQTKGEGREEVLIKAQQAINSKDYLSSLGHFDEYIHSHLSIDSEIRFYRALAMIGSGRAQEGREELSLVVNENQIFNNEALWYEALSYLSEDNSEKASQLLTQIESTASKYEISRELLEKLK